MSSFFPDESRKRPKRPVAVALSHDYESGSLPKVVASGRGRVAEQILEIAFANGVKVREDADLAEILAAVDVDSEIPLEAIVAVAEVLAHVYCANHGLEAQDKKSREEHARTTWGNGRIQEEVSGGEREAFEQDAEGLGVKASLFGVPDDKVMGRAAFAASNADSGRGRTVSAAAAAAAFAHAAAAGVSSGVDPIVEGKK
ncbi:hypothetical protein CCP2SC5_200023 [Azospirillaceae bacterium]